MIIIIILYRPIGRMERMVIIWLIFIMGSCSSCPGRSPNGTLCPSFCRECDNNRVCSSCCTRYFLNSTIQCERCNDLNCQICFLDPMYGNSCTRCAYPYGLSTGTPRTCSSGCSTNNAVQCSSLNNCNSTGGCISCYQMYVPVAGYCRQCNTMWQYCTRCNSTHCLACQGGRYLNKTNYRQCVLCSSIPRCNNCDTGPVCTSCNSGYYPKGSSCQPCRYPCLTCDSLTQCNSCNTTDRLHIMFNGSCIKCSEHSSTSNCTQCTYSGSIYTCYKCVSGFYLNGASMCVACPSLCQNCTNGLNCISCINNSYVLNAGSCNFCNLTLPNCLRCYDEDICIECEPEYTLNVTSSSAVTCVVCQTFFDDCQTCTVTKCLSCLEGYNLNSNQECVELPCNFPCLACRTGLPSTCLTCIQGFFYNTSVPNTCSPCDIGCQRCVNQTYCLNCLPNYINNNSICQLCPATTFYSSQGKVCKPCPPRCLSCDVSNCLACQQFFSIKKQNQHDKCVDTCGDGVVVEDQCDLKPNSLLDGCSDQCTIQNDFTCTYANTSYNSTNGSIMVNTSTCSYMGTISISVAQSKQSIVSNAIQLIFKVSPYLSGMPTSLDPESYLKSVFILNSTHSLGQFTVSVDESQGTVTFNINYEEDLSLANITFGINFDAITSSDPTLQYLTNTSSTLQVADLQRNGCFGKLSSSQDLSLGQLVYNCTLGLSLLGLALFFIGVFTKQLAGFEQMIIFQTIFTGLVFSEAEVTRPILSLLGFKYSLTISLPDSSLLASSSGYYLQTNNQNLSRYFIINFFLYLLPLLGFIFLLYKLKHKNFAYKAEIGRHASEFFKGQLLLYFALFNIFPLITYSKLFLAFRDDFFFWDMLLVLVSVLATLYAVSNYIFRPQIVGIFRSAFRAFSGSRQKQSQNCIVKVVSYRFCSQTFGQYYQRYAANHYYLFISYQILSALLIALKVPHSKIILISMQALVLLVLLAAKPYFNPIQKCRSILMFATLILANFVQTVMTNTFTLILALLVLCLLHALLSTIVIIYSFVVQIKRKCNDRSEVVKKMFKVPEQMMASTNEEKEAIQKSALIELINRFNESHCINPIGYSSQKRMINDQLEAERSNIKIINEEEELKEEVILEQENQHLRYQQGLAFFDKYGKELQADLIKEQYNQI